MNTVSGKKQQLLRRRDVQVVDVPAWGCDSAQSGGDGEEDHSKCVVAARVSCRHQEQRRSKHSCTVDSVILSTVECFYFLLFWQRSLPIRDRIFLTLTVGTLRLSLR